MHPTTRLLLLDRGLSLASFFGQASACDYTNLSAAKLFQDSAGTTPVTASGDPVGKVLDSSPSGNNATQSGATSRPIWQANSGNPYLTLDGGDDYEVGTYVPGVDATLVAAMRLTGSGVAQVVIGGNDNAGNRMLLGMSSDGLLAGGIGTQGTTTIKGGPSIAGIDVVGLIRRSAAAFDLWLGTSGGGVQRVFGPTAPVGTANTTGPVGVGILAVSGGSPTNPANGRIYAAGGVNAYARDGDVAAIMRQVGARAGISF